MALTRARWLLDCSSPAVWLPASWARHLDHVGLAMALVILATLIGSQIAAAGSELEHWDAMAVSGYAVLTLALWLARMHRGRFLAAVERIHAGRALRFPEEPSELASSAALQRLTNRLDAGAPRWLHGGGLAIAALMAIAWPSATLAVGYPALTVVTGTLPAALAGYFAGRQVGLLVYFGWQGLELPQLAEIEPQPGHPDGAAGLRPIGDFYLGQSLLLLLPAAHLLVWTLAIPFWDHGIYAHWRPWYQVLLAVAILLQGVAFIAPMWRFHQVMARERRQLAVERGGTLGRDIAALARRLEEELSSDERDGLTARLREKERAYQDIDQMPTWPLDRRVRRRFASRNLALIVPLAAQWLDIGDAWGDLARHLIDGPPTA